MIGSHVQRNDHQKQMYEIGDNFFRLDDGARMVDVATGKHFVAVLSSNGKVYAGSHRFYHYFRECRSNRENSEGYPFQLKMPEGQLAKKMWAHEKYNTMWVNCVDSSGRTKTFAGGQERQLGTDTDSHGHSFAPLAVPDGTYMIQITAHYDSTFAIDNKNNLWLWGSNRYFNDYWSDEDRGAVFEGSIGRNSKPVMCKWFRDKGIKILEIASGHRFVVCKAQGRDRRLAFYVLAFNADNKRWYGGDAALTEAYKSYIFKMKVTADSVASFACSRYGTYFLMSNKQDNKSMDPDNMRATGMLHFYQEEHPEKEIDGKKVKQWKFLTEQQYEERKATLPDICFATRHKIKGLAERLIKIKAGTASDEDWLHDSDLPDLQALAAQVARNAGDGAPETHD